MNSINIPLIAVSISFIGLIITLLKMLGEQKKYHQVKYTQEKRIEYKLRIHDLLLADILDYNDIVSKFQAQTPMSNVDPLEIRKCIYEMLTEKTIVSFENGCYTVDTVSEDEE
jgi:hypothetical protein